MVQQRRLGRRRRISHLHGFSSFSRSIYLVRPSSTTRHKFVKNYVDSKVTDGKRPTKIKQLDSSPSTNDSDEEQYHEEAIVQADFGFFDPKPGDFHGVKLLLQNYLDEHFWDLSGFVDLIIGQTTVGTVVKLDGSDEDDEQDEEKDLYAILSVLNIGRYGGQKCIVELKKFLVGVCKDENMKKKLKLILDQQASDVGLLVSQRVVNCPHQLVPPLYNALFDEVSWATEDEPTQELKDSFCFKFYVLVTRIFEKKHNQFNAKAGLDSDESIIYLKVEDEIFHEISSSSFTFHLHSSPVLPRELKGYKAMGLVMVIDAAVVPSFRVKLKSLLAES